MAKTKRPPRKNEGRPKKAVKDRIEAIKFDLEAVNKIAMLGSTDAQLADVLDVSISTITRWKKDKQFMNVLKKGKQVADNEIIKSLYKRGLGFEYEEVKIDGVNKEGKFVPRTITKTKKQVVPDTAACFIWLKNRQGWKDKQEFFGLEDLEIIVKLNGS